MARPVDRHEVFPEAKASSWAETATSEPISLEQRILLDAAMAETVVDTLLPDADAADAAETAEEQLAATTEPVSQHQGPMLAVVDPSIAGSADLISELSEAGYTVLELDTSTDGVQQISDHLASADTRYVQIHVFTHGKDGAVRLGDTVLSGSSLAIHQESIALWRDHLTDGADILLYGCDVAGSEDGQVLLQGLRELTGADIGASSDLTGSVDLGGDWDLEVAIGELEPYEQARLIAARTVQETLTTGWTDVTQLLNFDNANNDEHGWSVAIGDTSGIIGAGGWNQSDVYAYVPTGGGEYDEYKITPPATGTGGIAVDVDGNFMIVGYRGINRAFIYEFTGSSWVLRHDTGTVSGSFGYDVAIVATEGRFKAVVGAPVGAGRVYTYYSGNSGASWSAGTNFTTTDGDHDSELEFGFSVAIDRDTLVVGAPGFGDAYSCGWWSSTCNTYDIGRAYIFDWAGTGNIADTGIDHFLDADGAGGSTGGGWRVGSSVDVSVGTRGEMVVVGSPGENAGEVYVFRDGGNRANIVPSGATNDFGFSVAIDSNTGRLAVGEWDANIAALDGDSNDGRVWTYTHSGTNTWSGDTNFDATAPNIRFGWGLGLGRDMLVVGSPWADVTNGSQNGVVNVYLQNQTPNAVNDTLAVNENSSGSVNVAANDLDPNNGNSTAITVDKGRVLSIVGPPSSGSATLNGNTITFNPGTDFDYLAVGQSTQVTIEYLYLDSGGETDTATLTVTINGQNDAVVFDQGVGTIVGNANQLNSYQVPANAFFDADLTDVLSYVFVSGGIEYAQLVLNSNEVGGPTLTVSISAAGLITYTPSDANRGYTYTVPILRAKDPSGTFANDNSGFTIRVERSNVAPTTVGSVPQQNANEDQPYSFNMSSFFSDADFGQSAPWNTEALTYSLVGAPNWVTVNANTGLLQATGPNSGVGSHTFTVRVTDQYGRTADQSVTLVLANTNDAPIITNAVPFQQAFIGAAYSYALPADLFDDIDPTSDTITLSASFADDRQLGTAGPGQWLSFNPGTGTFSGTVSGDQIGTVLSLKVTATDNGSPNLSTDYYFDISVFPLPASGGIAAGAGSVAERGFSVAISDDGLYMVAGEPAAGNYAGTASVYFWNGSAWALQGVLSSSAAAAGDRFGYSVDIDADGNRIVIGAPGDDSNQGRVYAFARAGATWVNATENASYVAGARAAGDEFGYDVAIRRDGTRFLVGMPGEDAVGFDTGAVMLYAWGTATALDTLTPVADQGEGSPWYDRFGTSVDYDNTLAIIGAPYDSSGGMFFNGSATLAGMTASGFTGVQIKGAGQESMDLYGWSVALDVFRGVGQPALTSSAVVAVGAIGDDTIGMDAGAVHTYRLDGLSSTVQQGEIDLIQSIGVLTAYDGTEFDAFGISVAIDGGGNADIEQTGPGSVDGVRIAVGSNINGSATGSAYAYRYWSNVNAWVGQRYQAANGGYNTTDADNRFGWAVGIAGQRLVIGAPNADLNGLGPYGAVYGGSTAGSGIEVQPNSFDISKRLNDTQYLEQPFEGGAGALAVDDTEEAKRSRLAASGDVDSALSGLFRLTAQEAELEHQADRDAELLRILASLPANDAELDSEDNNAQPESTDDGAKPLSVQLEDQGRAAQQAARDFLRQLAGLQAQG